MAFWFVSRVMSITVPASAAFTADPAEGQHFNPVDAGGILWKNPLHTDAVGNLADSKRRVGGSPAFADDNALKYLNPLFFTFFDPHVDFNGIARTEMRQVHAHHFPLQFSNVLHNSLAMKVVGRAVAGTAKDKPLMSASRRVGRYSADV